MKSENNKSGPTKSGLLSKTGLVSFATFVVERYFGRVGDLQNVVAQIHAKKTRDEDARKRTFSAKLTTTPNAGPMATRHALILRETEQLKPILEDALCRIIKIEIARHELHVYRSHERKIRRDRSERDQRQLSELTYDFVDCLFSEFGIDGSALSTLEAEDYQTIAAIVLKRHRKVVPECYDGH